MTDNPRDNTARRLGVPIYSLLGGKVRNKVAVYAWIGGDRPKDVEAQALVFSSNLIIDTFIPFQPGVLLTLFQYGMIV